MLQSTSLFLTSAVVGTFTYFLTTFLRWNINNRRRLKQLSAFPSDTRHWFWGNLNKYGNGPTKDLAYKVELMNSMPRGKVFFAGPIDYYLTLYHPETVSIIFKTSAPKPASLPHFKALVPWLGSGLLLSGGKHWERNRKLINPAFHLGILRTYLDVYNNAANIMVEKLGKVADSGGSMEMMTHCSLLSLDIILQCIFSWDTDCQRTGEDLPYVRAIDKLFDLLVKRQTKPWLNMGFIYNLTKNGREFQRLCNYVHSVSEDLINKRKQMMREGSCPTSSGGHHDLLDILLSARDEDGKGLSDTNIRDEVGTFLFAGHDTSATSVAWMLYSMAKHPECQTKCQQEIDSVFEGRNSDKILWEDLEKMPYLTMCLKESMRIHSIVPFVMREITKPITIDRVEIPIGTMVAIDFYCLHHNPQVWEHPMEYKPERFEKEAVKKRHRFAYVPFSAGPRICIGQNLAMQEQKTVLVHLMRRFTFELDPNHPVEMKPALLMKAMNGIHLRVLRRT